MILLVIALIKVDASEGDYRRETARTPMNQKDRPMTAMTNRRPTAPNEQALSAFLTAKVEIDAMLERLKTHSDDHFDTHPDEVNWGHVGSLNLYASLLRQITDSAFSEGDHAD